MTKDELRAARASLGLSRKELAVKLGLKPAAIRNYEQGIRHPGQSVLMLLDLCLVKHSKNGEKP